MAAAVLGDAEDKVKYVPLSSPQRFTALQSGEIDVLARNTTWTMTRDTSQGSVFVAVSYYDGQGFIVPKEFGIKTAKELGRRHGLRPVRHVLRKDAGRLLQLPQDELQDGGV